MAREISVALAVALAAPSHPYAVFILGSFRWGGTGGGNHFVTQHLPTRPSRPSGGRDGAVEGVALAMGVTAPSRPYVVFILGSFRWGGTGGG